jgi:hypothetical protein
MSTATPIDDLLIEKLRIYLEGEGYSAASSGGTPLAHVIFWITAMTMRWR